MWDGFQRSRERMWISPINKAIRQQYNQFISAYKQGLPPSLAAMTITSVPIKKVMEQLYINVGLSWANMTRLDMQRKERRPMGFNEEMTAYILQYLNGTMLEDVDNMTDTTKNDIIRAIETAINNGYGIDEIIKSLSDANVTKQRARLIARTEIVTASNTASVIQANNSGLNLEKIWIAARDNRTRQDHVAVNGTQIPLKDAFMVGGYEMQQPGDRGVDGNRTPAKEVCNCRCTVAFIKVKG